MAIFNILLFLLVYSHSKAMTADPGIVPLPVTRIDFSDLRSAVHRSGSDSDVSQRSFVVTYTIKSSDFVSKGTFSGWRLDSLWSLWVVPTASCASLSCLQAMHSKNGSSCKAETKLLMLLIFIWYFSARGSTIALANIIRNILFYFSYTQVHVIALISLIYFGCNHFNLFQELLHFIASV